MRWTLLLPLLVCGCLIPVDAGSNDAGHDAGSGVCTVGVDQTCNQDLVMSSLAGHCSGAPAACTCGTGFIIHPSTGRCEVDVSPGEKYPLAISLSLTTAGLAGIRTSTRTPVIGGVEGDGGTGELYFYVTFTDGGLVPTANYRVSAKVLGSVFTPPDSGWSLAMSGAGCQRSEVDAVACSVSIAHVQGDSFGVELTAAPDAPDRTLDLFVKSELDPTLIGQAQVPIERRRPVCTVGMDQSCNDNPLQSSFAGHCAGAWCTCNAGFELNPSTGLCRTATVDGGSGVCTVGQDQTCNDDAHLSTIGGVCHGAPAACTCTFGFVLNASTGLCRLAGTCIPGQDQTCNENPLMSAAAGQCIAGTPASCSCNVGFSLNPVTGHCGPTPVCTVGDDRTCNVDPTELTLGGACVDPQTCHCANNGFTLDPITGRCVDQLTTMCWLETATGTDCHAFLRDGGMPPSGQCGSMTISGGCSCSRIGGQYIGECGPPGRAGPACQVSLDGGTQRTCYRPNCGFITCSTGTTCDPSGACL